MFESWGRLTEIHYKVYYIYIIRDNWIIIVVVSLVGLLTSYCWVSNNAYQLKNKIITVIWIYEMCRIWCLRRIYSQICDGIGWGGVIITSVFQTVNRHHWLYVGYRWQCSPAVGLWPCPGGKWPARPRSQLFRLNRCWRRPLGTDQQLLRFPSPISSEERRSHEVEVESADWAATARRPR